MTNPFVVLWSADGRLSLLQLLFKSGLAVLIFIWGPITCYADAIKAMTVGPVHAVRGDLVTLTVEPSSADSKVEWWFNGDVICESQRCDLDTTEFTPGEYLYHVVVRNNLGVETSSVSIATTSAPPLYKPKKLDALSVGPNKKKSFVQNGAWLMISRQGFITSVLKSPSTRKMPVIHFVEKPVDGRTYAVSRSGLAILRRVGHAEQWIILGGGIFKIDQERFVLLEGSGVWRRIRAGQASGQASRVFGLTIDRSDHQLVVASSGSERSGLKVSQIKNIHGDRVDVTCPGEKRYEFAENSQIDISQAIRCDLSKPESWSELEPILVKIFPWWIQHPKKINMDRWRLEAVVFDLFVRGDRSTESEIKLAFNEGRCADVLDLSSRFLSLNMDILSLKARCQFKFGMRNEAMKSFRDLESNKFEPPFVAFMFARIHHQSGDLEKALEWYEKAYSRGYQDPPSLARFAANAASTAGLSRTKLGWLDTALLTETDPGKRPSDMQNVDLWRKIRPNGARLEFGAFMDSQAIPVNSKELFPMPNHVKTSRAIVTAFDGDWWMSGPISQATDFRIESTHRMRLPTGVRHAPFAVGKHDVHLGLAFEEQSPPDQNTGIKRGWFLQPSFVVGVGTLGSFRTRERYGAELKLRLYGDNVYSLTFRNDKFLDPAPGGVDIVDIDLNRLTAPGDFSHIDSVMCGEILGVQGRYTWGASIEIGRIDYRVPQAIGYDHNLLRMSFKSSLRASPETFLEVTPRYTSRRYYDENTQDTTLELESSIAYRLRPLWMGKAFLGLEKRDVSNDPASSWIRHIYGVSLVTDL